MKHINAKKRLVKKILFIAMIAMIPFICTVAMNEPIFMDSQQYRYPDVLFSGYGDIGSYKFDPDTILTSLDKEDTDAFTLQLATSEVPIYSDPSSWKQSDYLKVANALQLFVSKESTDDWHLHSLSFYGECIHNPVRFDMARISFYKATGLQKYSARLIGIYLQTGEFGGWKNLDLQKMKITVEKALEIAEETGGKQARITVNNECRIYALLGPYSPGWLVTYSSFKDLSIDEVFEISINPYTGEYNIP
jgi:hypothetical protein